MEGVGLKLIRGVFGIGYGGIVLLFMCSGFALVFFAALELWSGIDPSTTVL